MSERTGIPAGALQRSVTEVVVGTARKLRARDVREAQVALQELELQFQLAISGTATPAVAFVMVDIDFDHDLFYAPGQRDSELTRPQMTCGAETDVPVMVSATVLSWDIDAGNGAIRGATVAVGVLASDVGTDYEGTVHLTFQGWGGLREQDSDLG